MKKIRIFIIDDHKLFVEGISSLLSDDPRFEIVGHALSGNELLSKFTELDLDIFLIDINMPEISGVELTRQIKKLNPKANILALTMYDDYSYVEKMIKSGAAGYVLKSANLSELSKAIEIVASGKKYFGEEIQEMVYNKISGKAAFDDKRPSMNELSLTKREIEILSLIVQEYTTQQIAEKLFISERTVETHRKNIFSKTKVKSAIGLSKFAFQHGIIDFK
ncbi:MAG: response regulator transcription factor [Bacteroidales bacterium]|jgi:DNA-binding NarL/FixJ family response regulator|nr:response regulator transcription factor [Bacteroidales bacterium]